MASNLLAPAGLIYSRNKIGASPTVQANQYAIKQGYASKIGFGDLVGTPNTGANQGYVVLSANTDTAGLGVFAGVLPYYDLTAQQTMHGLNGSWPGAAANASADIACLVISDPFVVFRAQMSGVTWAPSLRGLNCNFLNATNGAPNASGISTLTLDGSSVATTNTLPFRIEGVVGVSGSSQDPANTNPWVEVSLAPAWIEMLVGAGR